ncbi:MAG: sugar nucleotide-binding protein [bacterium]
MASDKVYVFGSGFLGSRIAAAFPGSMNTEVDITDPQAVRAEFDTFQPTVVVNAAALTLTGQLELPEHQANAYKVNVQGPANLAYICRERGIHMVHISTGMLFDGAGADGKGVREEEVPTPTNFYTWTKAWADAQLVPLMQEGVLITRIHTPFSRFAHPRNFLTKLQGFNEVVDEPASLTVVEDLLEALVKLVGDRRTGIYNVVSPGSISFYEIAQRLQKAGLIDKDKQIGKLTRQQVEDMMKKTGGAYQTYPTLNTDKLVAAGISLRPVSEAVDTMIKEYTV